MRTSLLLQADGTLVNPEQSLIHSSPIDLTAAFSLFTNQITVCLYNDIIETESGLYVPDRTTKVVSGLSGTLAVTAWPAADAPYAVTITPSNTINIASACTLQWIGITQQLDIECTGITGADYVYILLDRGA